MVPGPRFGDAVQTILYVFGPFIALSGVGVGAVYAAVQYVRKVVVPKGLLNDRRLRDARKTAAAIEANARHFNHADQVAVDMVLAIENDETLRDKLPQDVLTKLYALTEDRPPQLPEGGRR